MTEYNISALLRQTNNFTTKMSASNTKCFDKIAYFLGKITNKCFSTLIVHIFKYQAHASYRLHRPYTGGTTCS